MATLEELQRRVQQEGERRQLGVTPESIGRAQERVAQTEEDGDLLDLLIEVAPSIAGAIGGAKLGAGLGTAVAPGPGTAIGGLIGAAAGGVAGEKVAQETGIAPESDVNMALAAGGPFAGKAIGQSVRLGRRAAGAGIANLPFFRSARARNLMPDIVSEAESAGTKILAKQQGLMARPAAELYKEVEQSGVAVLSSRLRGTTEAIDAMSKELSPLLSFPEVRQAARLLVQVKNTLLGGDAVSLNDIVLARQLVGTAVKRAESAGGIKLSTTGQVFKSISDDLEKLAGGARASRTATASRTALAAIDRARLEFAVKDLEQGFGRFIKETPDGTVFNVEGAVNWVRQISDPKGKRFNKNLARALDEELGPLKGRLGDLMKQAKPVSPGGPASLVLRGQTAKTTRAFGGAILGAVGMGPLGALIGGVLGATLPETMVAILTTRVGAKTLEGVARMGQGSINEGAWIALGQMATRAAGERQGTPTPEAKRIRRGAEKGAQTLGDVRRKAQGTLRDMMTGP